MKLSSEEKTILKTKAQPIKNLISNMFGPQKWNKTSGAFREFCEIAMTKEKIKLLKIALELVGYEVRFSHIYAANRGSLIVCIGWTTTSLPVIYLQSNKAYDF